MWHGVMRIQDHYGNAYCSMTYVAWQGDANQAQEKGEFISCWQWHDLLIVRSEDLWSDLSHDASRFYACGVFLDYDGLACKCKGA